MTNKLKERFEKQFLNENPLAIIQFKQEVRGKLPQLFLKFVEEELASQREEIKGKLEGKIYKDRPNFNEGLQVALSILQEMEENER